jgi:hypothetical protein
MNLSDDILKSICIRMAARNNDKLYTKYSRVKCIHEKTKMEYRKYILEKLSSIGINLDTIMDVFDLEYKRTE